MAELIAPSGVRVSRRDGAPVPLGWERVEKEKPKRAPAKKAAAKSDKKS
jgi:hypothetical protein